MTSEKIDKMINKNRDVIDAILSSSNTNPVEMSNLIHNLSEHNEYLLSLKGDK